MQQPHPVARRYARALFDASRDRGLLDAVEADLDAVDRFLRGDVNARRLLGAGPLSTEERTALVGRLFGGRVQPIVLELLDLLLEKKRFALLGDVVQDFRERYDEARGIVHAEVASAVPLSADAAARIERALSARTGLRVLLEQRIDLRLIGGVRIRIGDRVIERSVRRSLEEMREELYGAPLRG